MGCCGKARANLSVSRSALSTGSSSRSPQANGIGSRAITAGAGAMQIRYLGRSDIVVRGPLTGRAYAFSPADPVHPVDRRDADILLRTSFFRQPQ
jgi:hypothetical protein